MITWRIVKWCGKTTNGIFAAKRRKKHLSWAKQRESSKDRWQTSHQLKVHWKNLQAGVADVTLRWLFSFLSSFFFWLDLNFPFSISLVMEDFLLLLQHLQSNLFYMTCWQRDVQMPIHHVFFKPITNLCYFNFWLGIQLEFLLQEFCFFKIFHIQMMNLPNLSSWISSR